MKRKTAPETPRVLKSWNNKLWICQVTSKALSSKSQRLLVSYSSLLVAEYCTPFRAEMLGDLETLIFQ